MLIPDPAGVVAEVVFLDMAYYSMLKNNTFNGMRLPNIGIYYPVSGSTKIIRKFSYED